ncbi:hypothetical protein GXP71_03000 [Cellulomonas sp. H30R-01]|uniref:DUF6507 family protein n=1 Tax=Cellulomonas sp. H30R-01 TaxID=2704467 RepID=UPI00138C8FAD|nr:DUF6507 family protein [Cellulomonas sp. H30R-01]QHT55158.1 hypothetical protein GXP71_03000 [Cellulomonas sp. H30R-01]
MTGWRIDPAGVVGVLERVDTASTDLAAVVGRATDTCVEVMAAAHDALVATELVAFVETYTALTAANLARVAALATAASDASALYQAGDEQMADETLRAAQTAWGWTS